MKMAQKWNFKINRYEPYELPQNSTMHEDNMEKTVICAECGKPMRYGASFTSLTIHNFMGFGYVVCKECHKKELKERLLAKRK